MYKSFLDIIFSEICLKGLYIFNIIERHND